MTNIFEKVQTAKHLKEREDLINLKDDWLIDTLMPSSQAGILVAPFKSFKSSLAMHMALMVSQGLPFLVMIQSAVRHYTSTMRTRTEN